MHESLWQEPRWNAGSRARPEGARAAARKAAEVTKQRLTAFRFLFISSYPGWNEVKSGSGLRAYRSSPDFASLHPGYKASDSIVMEPDTTTGFM